MDDINGDDLNKNAADSRGSRPKRVVDAQLGMHYELLDAEIDARLLARFDLLLDFGKAQQAVKINLNYIELELMFALS